MEDEKFMASFKMAADLGLDTLGDHTYDLDEDGVSKAGAQLITDSPPGKVIFVFPPDILPGTTSETAEITGPSGNSDSNSKLPPAPPARKREL